MQDVNELKNIIIQGFESKGILSQIRAQIRASVFKAIEDESSQFPQNTPNESFQWENKLALKIKDSEDLLIIAKLFENFLQFYDLEYSANVLAHETNSLSVKETDALRRLTSEKGGNRHGG